MQGRSLEVMSPAIHRYLQDQQGEAARASLIADLRKAGPEVRVLFDAPRQHDRGGEATIPPSAPHQHR